MLGGWWGLWREKWLYLWITATAREVLQCCCGRRLEQWVAFGVPVGCCSGLVAVLWAGAEECGRWDGGIIETIIFGYLLIGAV